MQNVVGAGDIPITARPPGSAELMAIRAMSAREVIIFICTEQMTRHAVKSNTCATRYDSGIA
jgi:hypothetical protein